MKIYLIGHQVRRLRTELGYSQEYLAKKMNITQSRYSEIENNQEDITFRRINRIAEILGKHPLDLILINGSPFSYNSDNSKEGFSSDSIDKESLHKIFKALELLIDILANKNSQLTHT